MSKDFLPGQHVRSTKGKGKGVIVSKDCDQSAGQIIAPNATYTLRWDDGHTESMNYPSELEADDQ